MPTAPTEKQFMRQVLQLARLCGWWCYHTHDSRRSEPGLPDLLLIRGPVLLFAELKTDRGRLSDEQAECLERIRAAGVEAVVWRPTDWPAIQATLTG